VAWGWRGRIRELVDSIYRDAFRSLGEDDLAEEENLLFRAVAGRYGNAYARLERTLVTLTGNRAPLFFRVLFDDADDLAKPFDFEGLLRGREYQVKVVVGPRAFNSTLRRSVEEESARYENPLILTLQGGYFKPQEVGRARWLSAPASWRLVTGEPGAYRAFRDIVFEAARAWAPRAYALVGGAAGRKKAVQASG